MAIKDSKDIKQRIEEGEFARSAEISTSYLDNDMLIIDNIKVLANPDPVRLQMNMIASCTQGNLTASINGREVEVCKNDIFVCPPNTTLDVLEVSSDFACTAMCVTNHGIQNILRSHVSVWNKAMYVNKVSIVKMTESDMKFYTKFTELIRICLDMPHTEHPTAWNPYQREIVETLLKSALLAICNSLREEMATAEGEQQAATTTALLFDKFLDMLQQSTKKHLPVEYFAQQLCITPKYLSIVCKRHSSKTAIEWITEYTLSDITYYLRSTNKSIKEISNLLGFSNTSFFGKYVREHLNMSPLKYRESQR